MSLSTAAATRSILRFPQGTLGLGLVAIFWPLNWVLPGMRTAYLFFPLWLGYILIVDGLVQQRTGSSILTRSLGKFALLFAVSAPAWWLFEAFNRRTANWEYHGAQSFSGLEYVVLCTISFSTVMPAVFETAELAASFGWVRRLPNARRILPSPAVTAGLFVGGLAMLGLVLAWPVAFYPLVWGAVVLILEPINFQLGRPCLLRFLSRGDWRPVVALSIGALICGFFWEMWNFYSYPKWTYHTPGAQFLHVFEMPLLGYLGYLPFAWELYAIKNLLSPSAPKVHLETVS